MVVFKTLEILLGFGLKFDAVFHGWDREAVGGLAEISEDSCDGKRGEREEGSAFHDQEKANGTAGRGNEGRLEIR